MEERSDRKTSAGRQGVQESKVGDNLSVGTHTYMYLMVFSPRFAWRLYMKSKVVAFAW